MNAPEVQKEARVLVVDDDSEIAHSIAEVLGDEGYTVAVAGDGLDAFAQMPRFVPDLILLDLMMPRMNGFEVLDRLREDRNSTPVVVVSAHHSDDAKTLKVAGKVRKPFNIEQLLAAVTAALETAGRT